MAPKASVNLTIPCVVKKNAMWDGFVDPPYVMLVGYACVVPWHASLYVHGASVHGSSKNALLTI